MAQVAIINGVKVYSDKQKKMIVNGIVFFVDGSFCDPINRQIHNANDSGYITFDAPPAGLEEKKLEPQIFHHATTLMVDGIDANLVVFIHQEIFIKVHPVSDVQVVHDGDTVKISGTGSNYSSGGVFISGGKGSVVIGGNIAGNIVMGNQLNIVSGRGNYITTGDSVSIGGSEELPTVYVYVPTGTILDINDVVGYVDIGDIRASLKLRASGSGLITIGNVTDLDFKSSGSSPIDIKSVVGDVEIKLTGSGNMSINRGIVDLLNVKATGSGSAYLNIEAIDADLKTTGSGSIRVDSVKNKPSIKITGSGTIRVRNW
jgi:hypothetical protein